LLLQLDLRAPDLQANRVELFLTVPLLSSAFDHMSRESGVRGSACRARDREH
jgi:hypothetical protein